MATRGETNTRLIRFKGPPHRNGFLSMLTSIGIILFSFAVIMVVTFL